MKIFNKKDKAVPYAMTEQGKRAYAMTKAQEIMKTRPDIYFPIEVFEMAEKVYAWIENGTFPVETRFPQKMRRREISKIIEFADDTYLINENGIYKFEEVSDED